jgi:hypothetical protein
MLQYVIKISVLMRVSKKSIFSYVSLINVQNEFHPFVCTIPPISKGIYEELVFARGGSKPRGGLMRPNTVKHRTGYSNLSESKGKKISEKRLVIRSALFWDITQR